jgi:hypothetical protein
MSNIPPPKEQPGQEPAFSIENVEFVDERTSTRSLSEHHGGVVYPGSIENSNNGGVVDERHRNYVQEAGYASVPTQGYGATAYYAQQHAQQQSYYGSGGHQHPPPSQYYGLPPYQGYGAPNHLQQPPPGSPYGQDWQGMPQVYDYGAPPGYGYAPQQQQQQQHAYTSSQQQQLQAQQQHHHQQQQQHRRARSTSSPVATHTRKSSEPIHPLKRSKESTFTASPWSDQAEHASLLQNNATGYGAVKSDNGTSNNRQSPGDAYMQPTFKSDPGIRGLDAIEKSMASALDRAGISGGPDGSLPRRRTSPSAQQRKSHRRASSDVPLRGARRDKIPPKASRYPADLQRMRKSSNPVATSNAGATTIRQRSFSASQSDAAQRQRDMTGSQLAPLGGSRPSHRRTSSMTSVNSTATDASHYSIVSDIRKSSFYGGVHETSGTVQMHYPFENVYLAVPDDAETLAMKRGHLYVANADDQIFENYHRVAEEIDLDAHWMDNPLACNCTCDNCNACTGKQQLLPPNYYAMAVDEDLYRRVLFEIAGSGTMPCGLFFCGHHEDVSRPSICIAVSIIFILFAGMGSIAFTMRA